MKHCNSWADIQLLVEGIALKLLTHQEGDGEVQAMVLRMPAPQGRRHSCSADWAQCQGDGERIPLPHSLRPDCLDSFQSAHQPVFDASERDKSGAGEN